MHAALVLFENGCVAHIIANYTTSARLERYEIHGREISAYLEGIRTGRIVYDGEVRELEKENGDANRSTALKTCFSRLCPRLPAHRTAGSQPRRSGEDDGASRGDSPGTEGGLK